MDTIKELWEKGIAYFTEQGISEGLAIAYIAVGILIVIMAIVALVMRIMVVVRYMSSNRTECSSGKTSFQVAREALDKCGLSHIKVKKASFLRAWFIGNCYSITKKTVFLRGLIADKCSLTAVGLALQKVGVAKLCESGSKSAKTRNFMQIVGLFGPFLFLPILIAGVAIDYFIFNTFGMFSIIAIVISLVILSSGFVVTLLNIPVEKKANKLALEMIDESGVCTPEEKVKIKKVLDTYIIAYICEFILTVLRIVQLILEIVMNVQKNSNNN